MKKVAVVALMVAAAGCGTKAPKPPAPPPLCVRYDTSAILFNYGASLSREQTIDDLVKRIDRYLAEYQRDDKIPTARGICDPAKDTVLNVRIDSLEAVSNTKTKIFAGRISTSEAQMKFVATMTAPGKTQPLLEGDDDPQRESLDELARKVASRLHKWTARFY